MREEFGKLLNYTVDENIVSIAYEKNDAYVKVITKNIVNFFVPKVSKERKSKAIDYAEKIIYIIDKSTLFEDNRTYKRYRRAFFKFN